VAAAAGVVAAGVVVAVVEVVAGVACGAAALAGWAGVALAGADATEVTPVGPAPGSAWKNTIRSNDGAFAPQPPPPAALTAVPVPFVPAFCELPRVTRVTPLITRSLDISRATSS
jgi:hypothetical protein